MSSTTTVSNTSPNATISETGVVVYETIETTGTYVLVAEGGAGGMGNGQAGGDGGIVTGTFSLTAGTTLEIVVGGAGRGGASGGGGGGGSFIYDENTGILLEAAGGGGGHGYRNDASAVSATTAGSNGVRGSAGSGGTMGSGGNAGTYNYTSYYGTVYGFNGGGGGGIAGSGGTSNSIGSGSGGSGGNLSGAEGPTNGVTLPELGGNKGAGGGAGGFGGGGGGGEYAGGGGGGYSGGGGGGGFTAGSGGYGASGGSGGGGGSFLATSATNATDVLTASNFALNTAANGVVALNYAGPPPLVAIISASVTSTVNPGNGTYATGITITNTGAINTAGDGIYGASNVPGVSINNSGTIISAHNYGVYLKDGGAVTNSGTASYIYGGNGGVRILGGSGTVMNQGTIFGRADYGIYLASGGTVINAGTISSNAYAVNLKSNAYNRLVIEQGAVFIGKVEAGGASNTLEFAATSGVGTLNLGSSFGGFNTISFDTGASWSVEGSAVEFDAGQTITGFTVGDTIILDSFVVNPLDTTYVTGIGLELTDTLGNNITLNLVEPPGAATGNFLAVDPPGTTTITYIACFAAGTRIFSAAGELIAVESLRVGDALETFDGAPSEIIWIGHRTIDLRAHPRPEAARPIRIGAGALGGGLPWRDLVVSPDHGMYLDGHLIPAKILLNGGNICQLDVPAVTYYHIELAAHAVIFAEGAAAESYLETGNRGAFENDAVTILHPDFAQSRRGAESCAPFVEAGGVVEAVRQKILDRANIQTDFDPQLDIQMRDGDAHIISRSAIPGQLQADPRDQRRLGVKIAAITIGGERLTLAHERLIAGWHDVEADGRWTDGHAVIPAALVCGGIVRVELAAAARYRISTAQECFSLNKKHSDYILASNFIYLN